MSKQSNFISEVRQLATTYRDCIGELQEASKRWSALYNGIVVESDFDNQDIIESPTKLDSFTSVISNIDTIVSTFDSGMDTNFERVTM